MTPNEYGLILEEDFNTQGHYQWFYFKTKSNNLPKQSIVKFKILNMIKPNALYLEGFKPFVYSSKEHIGWHQAGSNIRYYPNQNLKKKSDDTKCTEGDHNNPSSYYYTLEWTYIYEESSEEVYFAQFQPYSFTDLLNYLKDIKKNPLYTSMCRVNILCKAIARNPCPIMKIGEDICRIIIYYMPLSSWKNRMAKILNKITITSSAIASSFSIIFSPMYMYDCNCIIYHLSKFNWVKLLFISSIALKPIALSFPILLSPIIISGTLYI